MEADQNIPPVPAPPEVNRVPPPLMTEVSARPASLRQFLAVLLSVCLGLFVADAAISFVDESIGMISGVHWLMSLRVAVSLFAGLLAIAVYCLMALTPIVPKRIFVPLALFYLLMEMIGTPLFVLYPDHFQWIAWTLSLTQLLFACGMICIAQGRLKFGWPLVPLTRLTGRSFSWRNLIGFVLANAFVLLPTVLFYVFMCAAGLIHHFTDGFMALHPRGFTVEVRKYVRADGKTIQLFPMAHVAEANFYRDIANTFPTNSLILMEGVTDEKHLLQQKINYQRMARTLGLAEQHEQFEPTRGKMVMADIDVEQFTTNTLDLLNVVIRIHAQGVTADALQKVMQYPATPHFQERLFDDLLLKRNRHLLEQIQLHLPETEHIVVPWGVAHMPGVAQEIQQAGFHLTETKTYEVIKFHGHGN